MGSYKRGRVSLCTCALALAVGVLPACATTTDFGFLWGTAVDSSNWTGSRSSGAGGLSGSGGYANGFSVTWSITAPDNNGFWLYAYTLTAPDVHGGGMSHAIFGVTPDVCFPVDPLSPCLVNADGTPDNSGVINLYTATSNGNSNQGLPNGIVGGKFGLSGSSATVQFYSPNVPVWGDFYAKGGTYSNGGGGESVWNAVWNDGIGYISTTTDGLGNTSNNHFSDSTVGFIPRPDGSGLTSQGDVPEVPEPASLAMVGGGLLALAYGLSRIRRSSGPSPITSRR